MIKIIFKLLLLCSIILSQGTDYAGPDDPAGDIEAEREGYMNGNRVYLYYRNTTELSDSNTISRTSFDSTLPSSR